ncbi:response regulator [Oryzibacter oryziterrae]|uniref:response regulator n=1 Tax=Oryzibacter oryziterrae TaxID=2766474 RepID=UPI001F00D6CE|nr:response regulator [Oryzibacter oryziterrae]
MAETRILVVEDDPAIAKFLRLTLEAQEFAVDVAGTATAAQAELLARRPDVILLDLGLPDEDGQSFIARLREWTRTPIIVVSAREQEGEKIQALENGADDYLTKPFAAGELVARIRVALRHSQTGGDSGSAIYEVDGLRVDLAARQVSVDGEEVHLTPIEYKLLSLLVRHAGKVLTHGQLLKEVWGQHSLDNTHYLRIHTQHLREKLKDDPLSPRYIFTEAGIGYRLRGRR